MKKNLTLILFLIVFLFPSNLYSHCCKSFNNYRPPSRGILPCGCSYYSKAKFIGWDCNRKPIYIYEKISSHKRCKRKQYRYNNYYRSQGKASYKYKK